MINDLKYKCTGCNACISKCPKEAIHLCISKEGFWYPIIDSKICIDCGLCDKVCPVKNNKNKNKNDNNINVYAAYHKDKNILLNSSSGGLFYTIASFIICNNGIVVGACYDYESHSVKHCIAENEEELKPLLRSKYVQSYIEPEIFKKIKTFIESEKTVLFSGTPCQVAAIKNYIGEHGEGLITLDVVCHGVPSPKAWRAYLKSMETDETGNINFVSFRSKPHGWTKFEVELGFEKAYYSKSFDKNLWGKAFIENMFLRKCCYNCQFKKFPREGDITLGDFWGIDRKIYSEDLGCSLVLTNNTKGFQLLEKVAEDLKIKEVPLGRHS